MTVFKTTQLSDHLNLRANNFTLIRLVLAWLVLYGHSYAIAPIAGFNDPVTVFLKSTWIGAIAVSAFFAISGLLIAKSFVDRGLVNYTVSRILRIMPAIIICIILSTFLFGAIFTTLPFEEYLDHPRTWAYLKNMTLFYPVEWLLPGVFVEHNNASMNGSIWTLSTEIRCYILCAALGLCGAFRNRTITAVIAILLIYLSFQDWGAVPLVGGRDTWIRPSAYFLIGVLAYQWREEIPIHFGLFVLSIAIFFFARGMTQFQVLIAFPLTYIVYYFAFGLPHIDLDKHLGDISYGVYIYAFPVQQMLKAIYPEQGPVFNCLVSTPIVFILAYASWRLIEKPALSLKRPVMSRLSNIIDDARCRIPLSFLK